MLSIMQKINIQKDVIFCNMEVMLKLMLEKITSLSLSRKKPIRTFIYTTTIFNGGQDFSVDICHCFHSTLLHLPLEIIHSTLFHSICLPTCCCKNKKINKRKKKTKNMEEKLLNLYLFIFFGKF